MRAYFHGSTGPGSGHKLYGLNESWISFKERDAVPWKDLDGGLVPRLQSGRQVEGIAQLHHKDGWTALAFWDRTGDSRGNSNSVFVLEGIWTFDQALARAKELFPASFERFDFEIRPLMRYRTRDEAIEAAGEEVGFLVGHVIKAYEDAIRQPIPVEARTE